MLKPPNSRISTSALIQRILRHGQSDSAPPLRVRWMMLKPQQKARKQPFLAIVVSTKVSKKAVIRNRLRRQIKAIISPMLADFSPTIALVFLVMRCSNQPTFEELKQAVERLARKGRWRRVNSI